MELRVGVKLGTGGVCDKRFGRLLLVMCGTMVMKRREDLVRQCGLGFKCFQHTKLSPWKQLTNASWVVGTTQCG